MPVTAWYTAKDELIEGAGVEPDINEVNTADTLLAKLDLPMEAAEAVLQA
jgi:C-terminal processing protease CtpA/Prc